MSKSKFKVQRGLAQVITTGEPVYVTSIVGEVANVVRPVNTQANGIEYRDATFPVEQLETRFEAARRDLEFQEFLYELREAAEDRAMSLSKAQTKSLQALDPSIQIGNA